jgi:uncharacterized protein YbjT (DUF2867 family)
MSDAQLAVLVTGATGFIGRRLVATLVDAGHRVRALTSDPDDYAGPGDPIESDALDPASLAEAMDGVDIAVYLVHAHDEGEFRRTGAEAASAFGRAAASSGVRQIVYLGALGEDGDELPPQLRSRREVEGLLGASGVPVTVLRAGIVVGAGGVSWEMTRQLVKNLPAMVVPRWADTRTQPIAVDDVVRYLAGVVGVEKTFGQVYEIGGADQLTYVHMLQMAAEVINGRRVPIVTLPVMTQRLSSLWIGLVTDVGSTTASSLIDSMSTEVLQTDDAIQDIVPGRPLSYREAVDRAIAEERRPR